MMISRRNFLKNISLAALGCGNGFHLPLSAAAANHDGKLYLLVQAQGGWDPTSFCDPKANVTGEREINHWSRLNNIQTAGNLSYAPFGANFPFYQKYFDRMLVINGVDLQTNSHSAGVVHNWSGRISEGYPSLSALLSAVYAPDLPMSYLNFGGFSETAGIARYTRLDNPSLFLNITYPNQPEYSNQERFINDADWARVRAAQASRLSDMVTAANILPRNKRNRQFFQSASQGIEGLRAFAEVLPRNSSDLQPAEEVGNNGYSSIRRQIQIALLAFQTGVAISADLFHGGFDTHDDHDFEQAAILAYLTNAVDYLWDYAESLNLADRLVVVIASDFGRTPHYNDDNGKDHWPIGSVVVMEKNTHWSNRMVGQTDDGHNAIKINPTTLQPDSNGSNIYPKHIHKALRQYLGIEDHPIVQQFPFSQAEDFAFFT
ncbi:MAG: DUF1501 domain-containing protein [Pseudomonadales bacterium]|nr:DUF1501 domain-containing protein [Pseudomonadales bacterium]